MACVKGGIKGTGEGSGNAVRTVMSGGSIASSFESKPSPRSASPSPCRHCFSMLPNLLFRFCLDDAWVVEANVEMRLEQVGKRGAELRLAAARDEHGRCSVLVSRLFERGFDQRIDASRLDPNNVQRRYSRLVERRLKERAEEQEAGAQEEDVGGRILRLERAPLLRGHHQSRRSKRKPSILVEEECIV